MLVAKAILLAFEDASGSNINLHKSLVIYLNKTENESAQFASWMNYKYGSLPFQYLGLPFYLKKLSKDCWMPLIDKISSRLAA